MSCLSRMMNDNDAGVGGGVGGGGKKSLFPPEGMMALPPGRSDSRRIMSKIYSLFRGEDGTTEWYLRK